MHAYMQACICVQVHAFVHVCLCVCAQVHVCVLTSVHTCGCACVCYSFGLMSEIHLHPVFLKELIMNFSKILQFYDITYSLFIASYIEHFGFTSTSFHIKLSLRFTDQAFCES